MIEGRVTNPEDLFISKEDMSSIQSQIGKLLSPLEQQVLAAFLEGKSYQEIAKLLSRHVKSVDNALQRVKRKLFKYLEEVNQANQ